MNEDAPSQSTDLINSVPGADQLPPQGQAAEARMGFTGITNAPSQAVRLGGPETPLQGDALSDYTESKYGGPIQIGIFPDSEHPIGSRENPVNVQASKEANAAAAIVDQAKGIAADRLDQPQS